MSELSPTDAGDAAMRAAVDRLHSLGVDRVESFAWRDLDDPDAGGSELHADEIFSRWAAAGLTILHRTSAVPEALGKREVERNGYRVNRLGGRFSVFARVIASRAGRRVVRRRTPTSATIEIWNGVPWLGPLWAPDRRVVWMHHVHRDMWADVLPAPVAAIGRLVETRLAPPMYRRSSFVTLSESSAEQIAGLGIPRAAIAVVAPGVHERYVPDPTKRSATPSVLIVGRLAPVKRQRAALNALESARSQLPDLSVTLVGDGPDRSVVEEWVREHQADTWVTLAGRVSNAALVAAYQSAWLVVSASHAEGWGMSLTEAGACGTPSVATDIAGHRGAVIDGKTGVLVSTPDAIGTEVARLLLDREQRERLGLAAVVHCRSLSWSSVAARQLEVLCDVAAAASDR